MAMRWWSSNRHVRLHDPRHLRRGPRRHARLAPRHGRDTRLHARRDAGDGADALARRPEERRGGARPGEHLSPPRPSGRGRRATARRPAPLHGVGPSAPHRLGWLPGVLARGVASRGRGRRRVPEPRGRGPPPLDAGARDRDPMDARRRHRDGVRPCRAGGSGRDDRPGRPRADAAVAGTVREAARGTDGTMEGWKDGTIVPTFRRSIVPPDALAHPPRRHPSGTPDRRPAADPGARSLDRARHRWPLGRGAEARDVRDARGTGTRTAARLAALSYGRGVPRGPRGGGGAGHGPVRLRGAHAQRAQRLGVHTRRPGEHPQRRAPRRPAAARRDVRLRDVRHVRGRVPAAPVRGGGAARTAALVAAQRPVPDPAGPRDGRRNPRRNFSAVGRRMAAPLYPIGLTMHASYALLFTPSGQQGPAGWLVFQLVAVFAIIYFLILRPQKKQQERHRQLLASLQKGDRVVTSGGILGEVVHLKDDEVTVKSGEARLVVVRSNIANILNRSVEAKPQ